jgi:hypothetical protein
MLYSSAVQYLIHNQIFIQSLGFAGLATGLVSFQVNKRKKILGLVIWSSLFWTIHFFLLGAYTGSALNFIGAIRTMAFSKYRDRRRSIFILWGFIAAFGVATALTWQGPLSLLPAFGTISGAFAYWQKTPRSIRMLALLSPPAWLIYNVVSHSYAGVITEVLIFAATLVGIYRLDIQHGKRDKRPWPWHVKGLGIK